MNNKLITIPEAAAMFNLSEYEIRNGIRNGKYPAIKVGTKRGKYLILPESMDARLKELAEANLVPASEISSLERQKLSALPFRKKHPVLPGLTTGLRKIS